MKRSALSVAAIIFLAGRASLAADPLEDFPDPAAAGNLFHEAQALMKKGRYADACPKLEESLRRQHRIETQIDLAECNAHLGRIATARAAFLDVAARAKAANEKAREKLAMKRATALEAHLPKLVFTVPNAPEGLVLKCDGVPIEPARWGTEIPVDPGPHRVIASVPGKPRWDTTVMTMEGKIARIEVPRSLGEVAPIVIATPVALVTPVVAAPPPPVAPPPPPPAEVTVTFASAAPMPAEAPPLPPAPVVGPPTSRQRTIGWIVAAAGAAGLGVGAGFALASLNARDNAQDHCAGDACDATGVALREDAIRNGDVSTVFTAAGVALLVGGLALVLTAPKRSESAIARAAQWSPVIRY